MLDRDLAELYNVEVRSINQAVKRNSDRFPSDFMFQLNYKELEDLRSQSVIANTITYRNSKARSMPFVFTEAGAFALSFVLRSEQAVQMGQFIIRAFTHLRRFVLKNENLMMELKNNDHLSKTFSNFEKRIEHDLLVLYKNSSITKKKFEEIEKRLKELETKVT